MMAPRPTEGGAGIAPGAAPIDAAPPRRRYVFDAAPLRVYWELTRACPLACRHCRAEAMRSRHADELTTTECERVLDALAASGPPRPHVVLTGGDPLERPDLLHLVRHGVARGLGMAVSPSATSSVTREAVHELRDAGVEAMSLSIDGPSAAYHDGLRGVLGCFGWTLVAARRIIDAGIPLQINTLVSAETAGHLDAIADLVGRLGAQRWSLFFLISVGRGRTLQPLSPREADWVLRRIHQSAGSRHFVTTTTEAPHYRRILLQEMRATGRPAGEIHANPAARGFGVRDGNGVMFIAATGDVTPSGFLPLAAGNVRQADPVELYRNHPLFRALRDPAGFRGRCGACAYHGICGGSRARAWAATGDPLAEDPLCAWDPATESTRYLAAAGGRQGIASSRSC